MTKILTIFYCTFLSILIYLIILSREEAYMIYKCPKIEGETILHSVKEKNGDFKCVYNVIYYGQAPQLTIRDKEGNRK